LFAKKEHKDRKKETGKQSAFLSTIFVFSVLFCG